MKLLYPIVLLAAVLIIRAADAQQRDSAWVDIEYFNHTHVALTGNHATALQYIPINKLSIARAFVNRGTGNFINFYQSNNSFTAGVFSESFYRFNPKVFFHGKVMYQNFTGKNMAGSALIDPYKHPVDINEYQNGNEGSKKLETYVLSGAVSANVTQRLTLGGSLNYQAANYAKMKDLRHANRLLDMDVSVSSQYEISKVWQVGFQYSYGRRIESVEFSIYGNTDQQYLSLINFGSFYGISELFTDYGYTSERRPLVNNTHRISIQLITHLSKRSSILNEFSYAKRTGYYGVKGTNSIVFTEHIAPYYQYLGSLLIKQNRTQHVATVKASYERLDNFENVYRRETTSAGNSKIVYYGQRELLYQNIYNVAATYTAYFQIDNQLPKWTLSAKGLLSSRNQMVLFYPFYRRQEINNALVLTSITRSLQHQKNRYGIFVETGYGSGGGKAVNDGVYIQSAKSTYRSRDRYVYQEYEFLTRSRIQTTVGLEYARNFSGVMPFIKMNYSYSHAYNVQYIGANYTSIDIALGCKF